MKVWKAALAGAAALIAITGCQSAKSDGPVVIAMRHTGKYSEPNLKTQFAWTCSLKPTKCWQVPAYSPADEQFQPECWRVTLYSKKKGIQYRCLTKINYTNTVPGDPFHG